MQPDDSCTERMVTCQKESRRLYPSAGQARVDANTCSQGGEVDKERALLLALPRIAGVHWSFVAREARRRGSVQHLLEGHCGENTHASRASMRCLAQQRHLIAQARDEAQTIVAAAARDGIQVTTILDDDYPPTLRGIRDVPPFLFYRGTLSDCGEMTLAVVGTRQASPYGLARARSLSALLAREGVTVVSGLARGIDTAAHEACLAAGGRTVAVLGSGLRRIYPKENVHLFERIAHQGAVVSQFWPDTAPSRKTFPIRNAVSSGLSLGTIVIEASRTSGAKMQARLALEQGRLVLLPRSLVEGQEWARDYLLRGAIEVPSIEALEEGLQALLDGARARRLRSLDLDEEDAQRLFAVG